MSGNLEHFYIGGRWVEPASSTRAAVVDPATEEAFAQIGMGNAEDVDRAVRAARAAFPAFAVSSKQTRVELLERVAEGLSARTETAARAMTQEMGAPLTFSREIQVATSIAHFAEMAKVVGGYSFARVDRGTLIVREPIGVCSLITPWNWPLNQLAAKVAPALGAGCTVVVKPSEIAPVSALVMAEVMHEAGVPPGVFNLVNGDGPTVGHLMSVHPEVDMVSFTGSTRTGVQVAKAAADTVKRVHQELGGKSANIILPDADLGRYVRSGVLRAFTNSGQSCQAPTRMLIQRDQLEFAEQIAREAAQRIRVGGPLVSAAQFERVQGFIATGIEEGARLVCGGPGRPEGLNRGFYVRPTVFSEVDNNMTIAREEIFGPVLTILPYDDEDDAVRIANDSIYGLAGYVSSGSLERARAVGGRLRAGRVYLNDARHDVLAPFGGYKQSGNGREFGVFGLEDFLEVKAMLGYQAA